jgi:hypothetical protein
VNEGSESEICNGEDDDCDGIVDNGADQDNDGFTWCGGGHAELADCAPYDPAIHPARPAGPDGDMVMAPVEECDGKDNDCDSKVDEGCPAPMYRCERNTDCTMGQTCNVSTGMCIEQRPVGSGCQMDSECAGGFCVKKGQFALGVQLPDNRCASACCTDSDCMTGSVCLAGDSGLRVCLPADIAARGTKAEAARCSRDTECATGSCVSGRCAAPCSTDAECKAACGLSSGGLNEARRWVCGDTRGSSAAGSMCRDPLCPPALLCGGDATCRSGYCGGGGTCVKACGRNADCGPDAACGYQSMRPLFGNASALVLFCEPRSEVTGDPLCCTNADCGKGKQCMPNAIEGGLWTMVCR